jgi:two-component system, NarL family, invasion response regulator UvrY
MLLDPEINAAPERVGSVGVLTVDDQAAFRGIARNVIDATTGFHPVGEAGCGEEALEAVQRLRPGLVLLDVRMSGVGGIEAARRIGAAHPGVVVVLMSVDDIDELPGDVQSCGAATFVRKQDFGPALLRELWRAHGRNP